MCGPHFCSMKITEDVRKYAAEQELSDDQALTVEMQQKAQELQKQELRFTETRSGVASS